MKIEATWKEALKDEFEQPYFQQLREFVKDEYRNGVVYPPANKIFAAFDATPIDKVKVVIIGQDPYHGPNQAEGLCFSVADGVKHPPSLVNIFKEIHSDLGTPVPVSGSLRRWASQGVLLLNATLTVRGGDAGSHQRKGWEDFTDSAIQALQTRTNLVYMLWGSYAQKKGQVVDPSENLVLKSPHPSPLSAHRGFFGNKHFSRANEYLLRMGKSPIDW